MSFAVAVDTREVPRTNTSKTIGEDSGKETKPTPTPEPVFPFSDVPEDKRGPKIQRRRPGEPQVVAEVPSLDESLLPAVVVAELRRLDEKLQAGDITVKGYNVTKAELLKPYEAQQQQVVQPQAAAQVQGKPYKDLEGEVEEKPADIQKNQNSKEEISKKSVAVKTAVTTPLIPVHIDDGPNEELERQTAPPVNAAIERPKASKLLSSISKIRSSEGEKEPANAAAAAAAAPVGRRLQHFVSADRGFLPWERRKFFQRLLEVGGAHSVDCSSHYYLHASHPVCVSSSAGGGASAQAADVRGRRRRHSPEAAGHVRRLPPLRQQAAQQPVWLHVPQSPRPHASHDRPAHHAGAAGHVRLGVLTSVNVSTAAAQTDLSSAFQIPGGVRQDVRTPRASLGGHAVRLLLLLLPDERSAAAQRLRGV